MFRWERTFSRITEAAVRTSARTVYGRGLPCPPPTDWYHLRDATNTNAVELWRDDYETRELDADPVGFDDHLKYLDRFRSRAAAIGADIGLPIDVFGEGDEIHRVPVEESCEDAVAVFSLCCARCATVHLC